MTPPADFEFVFSLPRKGGEGRRPLGHPALWPPWQFSFRPHQWPPSLAGSFPLWLPPSAPAPPPSVSPPPPPLPPPPPHPRPRPPAPSLSPRAGPALAGPIPPTPPLLRPFGQFPGPAPAAGPLRRPRESAYSFPAIPTKDRSIPAAKLPKKSSKGLITG